MSARAAVHQLVEDDLAPGQPLAELGYTSVYASGDVDSPDDVMFIIIRWEGKDRRFATFGPERVSLWAHTRDLDYGDLDKALERFKHLLGGAVHVVGGDGWTLTQADWRGDSADLRDDGFGTLTRYAAFDAVSRYDSH